MLNELNRFVLALCSRIQIQREEGQALVEYTLILALVSIVAISLLTSLGTKIVAQLQLVVNAL